jgi:hypothetical protein
MSMHLSPKKEATRSPAMNTLQQQEKFDHFVDEFNRERPHEALGMKRPVDSYAASTRAYCVLPDISYPRHRRHRLQASDNVVRLKAIEQAQAHA